MKKIFTLAMLLVLFFGWSSCQKVKGTGEIVNQVRGVTNFNGINLAIDGTVYFSPDSNYYLEVSAQQNMLDVLETVIGSNNTLIIRYKSGVVIGKHEPIRIFIAAPDIRSLTISGSGDILVDTPWHNQYMEASISGSGNISIVEMQADEFNVNISGSGNLQATSLEVTSQDLRISGSGNIDLVGVESETTNAHISGSGNIKVWVTKQLDVTISGSGNVSYKGDPVITQHISGSGSIIKL